MVFVLYPKNRKANSIMETDIWVSFYSGKASYLS